jgi:uncharacterized membrane protein YhaH (DUF805 family)
VVPILISGFAIGVRRLHDRNRSGWLILLFYLGPAMPDAIDRHTDFAPLSFALELAGLIIAIWALVELGFLRGTVGPNQYGPDPLARTQVAAAR